MSSVIPKYTTKTRNNSRESGILGNSRVGENFHIGYVEDYPFIELGCFEDNPVVKLKAAEIILIVNNSINFVKAKTEDLNNGLAIVRGKKII